MKKIGIIGTGIAGLTSAYYLSRHHDITVFEANDYIGGHTHTIDIEFDKEQSAIDTGFIVFNNRTYPNFIRLLDEIGVHYQPTEMSFSVRNDAIGLEYNGHDLDSLFAQRKNLINAAFLRMLYDIMRFNRSVRRKSPALQAKTIGDFLDNNSFGELFTNNYLLPMIAAIWSMGIDEIRAFPLQFFTRFFENHGLLDIVNRPQWYSIIGGSRSYIEPLTAPFTNAIRLSSPVQSLARGKEGIIVTSNSIEETFDEVIVACHGDEALDMLADPSELEQQVLGSFRFTDNDVIVHTDSTHLPKAKKAWASWNYRINSDISSQATLTYNMNILQCLEKKHTYLVTINEAVADEKVLARFTYAHPVYNNDVIEAQDRWGDISGVNHVHYCGAYWLNGFHEDGVRSALRVCEALGVTP
jgi:predicted NAD/FAD-binding protein